MKNKTKNFFQLKNKIFYILGGSGLIGKELVEDLLILGAKVISLDVIKPNSRLCNSKNFKFIHFDCENIENEKFNIIDIFDKNGFPYSLVNCSYPRDNKWSENNFSNIEYSSLKKNIELNLLSYSWIAKETANFMYEKKIKGNILLLGSIYGFLGQDLNLYENTQMRENMTYSIIKGGIINLVKQMSAYYGKFNIRVNCLSPGGLYGHNAGVSNNQTRSFIKRYEKKTPLSRLGYPSEISKSIIFLCSPKSSYITGSNLIVDGGISII